MLWVGLRQNTRWVIVRNLMRTTANDYGGRAVTRRKKAIKKYSTHFSAYCLPVTKTICRRVYTIFLCPLRVTTIEGLVTTMEGASYHGERHCDYGRRIVTTMEDLVTTEKGFTVRVLHACRFPAVLAVPERFWLESWPHRVVPPSFSLARHRGNYEAKILEVLITAVSEQALSAVLRESHMPRRDRN